MTFGWVFGSRFLGSFFALGTAERINLVSVVSNVVVTLGLLYFAKRQADLQHSRDVRDASLADQAAAREIMRDMEVERRHREERLLEEERAFRTVHAEAFRLFQLADRIKSVNIVQYALKGLLDPHEIRMADPAATIERLALLSRTSGLMGTTAPTASNDAAVLATAINREIFTLAISGWGEAWERNYSTVVKSMMAQYGEAMAEKQKILCTSIRNVGLLLEDACMQWPQAHQSPPLDFTEFEPQSPLGKDLKKSELAKRGGSTAEPNKAPLAGEATKAASRISDT
jgi:hypothetical protein